MLNYGYMILWFPLTLAYPHELLPRRFLGSHCNHACSSDKMPIPRGKNMASLDIHGDRLQLDLKQYTLTRRDNYLLCNTTYTYALFEKFIACR